MCPRSGSGSQAHARTFPAREFGIPPFPLAGMFGFDTAAFRAASAGALIGDKWLVALLPFAISSPPRFGHQGNDVVLEWVYPDL